MVVAVGAIISGQMKKCLSLRICTEVAKTEVETRTDYERVEYSEGCVWKEILDRRIERFFQHVRFSSSIPEIQHRVSIERVKHVPSVMK